MCYTENLDWAEISPQPYPFLYTALLYGTECKSVCKVPLPLDHDLNCMISLDDLATDWWMKGSQFGGHRGNNLTDLTMHRHTIVHSPTLPKLELEHAYTICKSEFPLTRNKLIQELFGISKCMGNLLVVRHPRGDLDKIMDINDSDRMIVDLILRW